MIRLGDVSTGTDGSSERSTSLVLMMDMRAYMKSFVKLTFLTFFAGLSSSEDEEDSSCFLRFLLSTGTGWKRGRRFGIGDNLATEDQLMTDNFTS